MIELEYARQLWHDGQRRLRELDPDSRRAVDRVVDALVAELRRRLGSRFTAQELADLYDGSQRWTMALAVRVAPGRSARVGAVGRRRGLQPLPARHRRLAAAVAGAGLGAGRRCGATRRGG